MNLDILKGKVLLIVDDEPDLREPLVTEFESLGCRVFDANNGKTAFEIIKREKIDAVVSDIRMPGGDGVELLTQIKNLHHEVPVVMLITGFSDLSREEAYDLGAEAVLSKPFDLDEIDLAVSRILTPREQRWSKEISREKIKKTVENQFESISEAFEKNQLRLGRGGFFIHLASGFPLPGQEVSINIRFNSGDLLVLEGTGIVRWVRREDASDLLPGCGIEFEYLSEDARNKALKLTDALKLKAFIPKH